MSTIKSSDEHLTLNADGSSKDIKFQANGVEKASISSAGAFTSTTIDATALTGNLPAISGASLTGFTDAQMPTGSVLQVVQTVKTDTFSTSTTDSYVDVTGMSVSITPSSTSNKVLIILSSNHSAIATGWAQGQLALSDNTQLMTTFARAESGLIAFPFTHVYLHSPSSTSAVTYKMRLKGESGTSYVNRPQGTASFPLQSTITVMEIAG